MADLHHLRWANADRRPPIGYGIFEGHAFEVGIEGMSVVQSASVANVAAFLFASGISPDDVCDLSPSLSTPCRLIRFDTHGTVFVIEERLPELIALLRQAKLESAVHKQGYAVERRRS